MDSTIDLLQNEIARLRALMDSSQSALYLLKPVYGHQGQITDFTFVVVNKKLSAFVGQEPEALRGTRYSQWFPQYRTNGIFEYYCRAFAQLTPLQFEHHYINDGTDSWLTLEASRLGDELQVTFLDITENKRIQYQLEATIHQIKNSNENLEQFAYIASHDLQEPLRKLQAFGDVLQSQFADSLVDGEIDLVRRIQNSAKRMQVLVRDLLTYSRLSTQTEPFENISLSRLIKEVLNDLEIMITEKQATVRVSALPNLLGNPLRLRQLFQNLVANAIKFQKPDQKPLIQISARHAVPNELPEELKAQEQRLFLLVEVADNGIGFDEKYKSRIFQPFQRLESRSTYSGTGIGLAICKKVAEIHGGVIDVSSQVGQGSTFKVFLPVYGRTS
ncbi:PAS domain-containing protein [Larkinella arboricola]|uniref:histidine kinase n=1 Tax=Larkinella arboricola TaxID=643671 RepID=A0A327X7R8_LARAB|nr:ATP-binding protein [Larkinella arboricola]RAK02258.1 PAS domain-containing protein [Larkinella arboricola]